MSEPIASFTGQYAFLSNFSRSILYVNGYVYATVEHYFQAQKTDDARWRAKIRQAQTPGAAKLLGNACPLRSDWEQDKENVMYRGLQAKFADPFLRKKLLATGDRELIEGNQHGDREWGQVNGVGENKLGKLLMKLREEIRANRTVTL